MAQNSLKFMLSALVFCLAVRQVTSIANLNNQIDFVTYLNAFEFKTMIFYNSAVCKRCLHTMSDLVQKMENWPLIQENKIHVQAVDTVKIANLKSQYSLPDKTGMVFFFRNDAFPFPEFNRNYRLFTNNELTFAEFRDNIESFLLKQLGHYVTEINSLSELNSTVSSLPTMVLFVGPKNYDYELYMRFAYVLPDQRFFAIHNTALAEQFMQSRNITGSYEQTFFVLFRSLKVLDDQEPNEMLVFRNIRNFMLAKRFLEYERGPRLRKPSEFERQIFDLIAHKERMLLYVGSGNNQEAPGLKEFVNAIRLLPKSMMYCHSNPDLDGFPFLMHLFDLAGHSVSVETLYFLHINQENKILIMTMKKPITKENIIEFVIEFFKKHQGEIHDSPFIDISNIERNRPKEFAPPVFPRF